MKILKIRLKNLNSLAGEWEIDFEHPHYTEDGLFVISGNTGSGKTTILDAICLALYGATPRLPQKGQAKLAQEIRTYGCSDCFSEVTFLAANGKRWRCKWAQTKNSKSTEEFFHELVDDETKIPVASKVTEVSKYIEDIVGMSFKQFTRSVMLAQGRFGEFLDAGANERALLLEQLAGTEKYRDISKLAYQRFITEERKLNLLQEEAQKWILLKDDVWETEQRNNLQETEDSIKETESQKAKASDAERWRIALDELEKQLGTLAKDRDHAKKLKDQFEPTRIRLEAAKRCIAINPFYEKRNETQNEYAKTEKELQQAQENHATVLTESQNAKANLDKAKDDRDQARTKQENEGATLDEAIRLDAKITQLGDRQSERNESFEAAKKDLIDCRDSLRESHANLKMSITLIHDLQHLNDTFDRALTSEIEAAKVRTEQLKSDQVQEQACVDSIQDELVTIRLRASLEEHRKHLKPGEACPLCGALEHPYSNEETPSESDASERLNQSKKRLQKILSEITQTEKQMNEYSQDQREIELIRERLDLALQTGTPWLSVKEVAAILSPSDESSVNTADTDNATFDNGTDETPSESESASRYSGYDMPSLHQAWQAGRRAAGEVNITVAKLVENIKTHMADHVKYSNNVVQAQDALEQLEQELHSIKSQRVQCYQGDDPAVRKKELATAVTNSESLYDKCQQQYTDVSTRESGLRARAEQLQKELEERQAKMKDAADRFESELRASALATEQEFVNSRMTDKEYKQCQDEKEHLDEAYRQADLKYINKDEDTQNKRLEAKTDLSTADCQALVKTLDEKYTGLIKTKTQLKNDLDNNETMKKKAEEQKVLILNQKIECDRWRSLKELIGSKNGDAFSRYAQKLTCKYLLQFANKYLYDMTNRYRLVPSGKEGLDFSVRDECHRNQSRSVSNLSGGERFMVCLSLALGLSRMASKKARVDSLFLDEGFGTLDDDALSTAIESLHALREDGKMVGVISHVKTVREKIETEIVVESKGNGTSNISGPGVKHIA